ncbi:hypothetical protein SAMN05216276_1001243 [Streptosporangium subroseum]|uniref:Uncharacterized protein n=1 Tax=Streptosporangium subroseum TaxID=106412 RepID=A0A239A9V5_9ACTN|nr:hypothetical protein [Streptosporangium subroseum]SNR92446.1 hypothetical protein SAMN05216276_1001243 [Streptosporangium subroseum]
MPEQLVQTGVTLIVAAGLVCALAVLLAGGGPRTAMAVLLDLLLAAGLLRLSLAQTWTAIAVAALTVVIRKVAIAGFSLPLGWGGRMRWSGDPRASDAAAMSRQPE